jgi:LysM repeat protein
MIVVPQTRMLTRDICEAGNQKREAEIERLDSKSEEQQRDYDNAFEIKSSLEVELAAAQKAYDEASTHVATLQPSPPKPPTSTTYTVKSGDTLGKIAGQFLNDSSRFTEIAEANGITNSNLIEPGQVLTISLDQNESTTASDTTYVDAIQKVQETRTTLMHISARLAGANDPKKLLSSIEELKAQSGSLIEERPDEIKDFKDMTDEEKKKALAEQEKAQGTFGRPLGNIQEAVVEAYIEYIFDVMNLDEIGEAMSQVPGGTLVFNTLNQIFKCSSQGLFNPPIKSFLSSLSLDVCGDDRHVGLAIPSKVKEIEMPEFSKAFFIKKLKNAFIAKMETVITKVITMLLLKVFESVDNALCKSLNAIGQAAIGTLTGGSGATLSDAFADAFCPDADEDDLDNVQKNLFGNALGKGAASDSAYDCLFKAVNGTMSKREILDLLTNTPSNMDDATASKFALLVNSRCPELSELLGDPEDVKDAFGSMGKYIPPELKEYLRGQNDSDLDAPIYDAICLTQDELDLWNANRKQLYLDNGLDEATADELINKANDRALDNLGALSDIVQKGPQGLLEEAIDAILKQPDPACANDPAAILVEDEELASAKADLFNSYFERIEGKFLEDLIGENASLIGNILIDTEGNHMQQHNRRVKVGDRTWIFANYVDTEEQWDERNKGFKKIVMNKDYRRGMLPETVGISMLNQLKESDLKYKTNKDEPQLKLRFESTDFEVFRDTTVDTILSYKLNHNKKSTQRAFIRENIDNPPFKPTSEIAITARRDQVFEPEDVAGVNYEVIPNEIKVFKDMLIKKSNSSTPIKTSRVISLFDNLNSKALTVIRDAIIETPKGDLPVGFKYGYEEDASVGFEDLQYVNPDANPDDDSTWEYTFKEEDAVLGKSATENPRVHFLDPAVHGGRYKFPKIYIEPATYGGWLGIIRTFVPQIQTCEDKDNGFLDITGISNRVKKVESNLPIDSRLSQPLECRLEVPYDRQIMPANHGLIEGIVISTIRTYATEFMVRSFPVFGSIQFNDNNYDSLISKALADHMQTEMSDAGVFSNISRLAYYLLFLEQCVQVAQRQIIDGLMEETEEMKEASKIINRAQNNYEKLRLVDLYLGRQLPSGVTDQLSKGSKILAYGNQWETKVQSEITNIRALNGYKINLARKVAVIYDTQKAAEVFLAALVAKETITLSKKMNLNLRPFPHVYDIGRYMLSTKGIVDQSDIKAGFATVEQEVIEGGSQPDYGSILDCAGSDLKSPLGSISKTLEDIKKTGFMYLEKYVRVINKDSTEQVMKISEFQQMLSDRATYDEELRLSDYFGNAFVVANTLQGSIGVKLGVRLMMCLDKHIGLKPDLDRNVERIPGSLTYEEESFGVLCFPVASYELDVIDDQIKDLDLEDPTMGEDIKCYVDQLTETEDYKLLFDTIIKTRSFCSLFGIYSFQNFVNSIGQVEVEDENQKILMNDAWKRKIFDETKRLLRKQFRSVYNSQDDQDGEKSSSNRASNIDFLKNLVPDLYLNIKGVGFLQRLRIVDANPFDEDGKPCVNEFQKIFED